MQTLLLKGQITLDDSDLNRMNYIITNPITNKQTSISDILDTIYNSKNSIKKLVRVCGKICVNSHQFHCFEGLHIQKDKYGCKTYFVGNFPLENQLFELVDEECEIYLEDYTDSISEFIMDTTEDITYDRTKTA